MTYETFQNFHFYIINHWQYYKVDPTGQKKKTNSTQM